jgi:hypothetical protein
VAVRARVGEHGLLAVADLREVVAAVDELALDRRDLLQPPVHLGGDATLALLEAVELGLCAHGVGLRGADAVDDPPVLVADPLDELRARDEVLEAVGLEDHRDHVGLVGLVDLDEPLGERVLGGGEPCAQLDEPDALLAQVVLDLRQLRALGVEVGLDPQLPRLQDGDVALQRVDPLRVAGDRRGEDALLAPVLLDLALLLLDPRGERGAV